MLEHDDLRWEVESRPVTVDGVEAEGFQAIRRADTGAILGIHGARYEAVQNSALNDLAEVFAGEAGATRRGSWALNGGKLVGIQLEDGAFRVPGDPSEYRDFFVLANSFDGSRPVLFHPTQVRIVCQNTFMASLRSKQGAGYVFRHTSSVHSRIEEVKRALSLAREEREHFAQWAQEMQGLSADRGAFVDALVGVPDEGPEGPTDRWASDIDAATRAILEARATLQAVIERPTQDGIRESAWGLFNAGVEYLDHFETPRRRTKGHEARKLLRTIGLAPGKERVREAIQAAIVR